MNYLALYLLLGFNILAIAAKPTISREAVAIIYNSDMPESKELAEYYANKRAIPAGNLVGLPLSKKGKRDTWKKP